MEQASSGRHERQLLLRRQSHPSAVRADRRPMRASFHYSFSVHLGAHNISDLSETGRQIVSGSKIYHSKYNMETGANDIALIKLYTPAAINNRKFPYNS